MSKKLILLDCGFLTAQSRATLSSLSTEDMCTGIIFGFLGRLLFFHKIMEPCQFVFLWDSKHSHRKKAYPEYKANRRRDLSKEQKQEEKNYRDQVLLLRRKIIPFLGFANTFIQKGLEADDLIAQAIQQTKIEANECVIVSMDSDLYQLFSDRVSMFRPGGRMWYSEKDFERDKGISPKDWWRVKAIAGCVSDNVKGVPLVGEVSAIKYILKQLNKDQAKYKAIRKNLDIIMRNEELVRLPHKETSGLVLGEDRLSYKAFERVCKKYEFDSFLEGARGTEWKSFFGAGKSEIRRRLNG